MIPIQLSVVEAKLRNTPNKPATPTSDLDCHNPTAVKIPFHFQRRSPAAIAQAYLSPQGPSGLKPFFEVLGNHPPAPRLTVMLKLSDEDS
jgi:hypothetical protein